MLTKTHVTDKEPTQPRMDAGFLINIPVGKNPTQEEEHELFRRYQEDNDQEAFEQLYYAYGRLVIHVVKKRVFNTQAADFEDCVSVGTLALFRAFKGFKCDAGYRFTSYAYRCISTRLTAYLAESTIIRVPHYLVRRDWENRKLGVCETIHNSRVDIVEDRTCPELEPSPKINLSCLTEREAYVINAFFFEDKLLREIGNVLGVTRQRAAQIKDAALEKLRDVHCEDDFR